MTNLIPAAKLWRIRPLEWKQLSEHQWEAESVFGFYCVQVNGLTGRVRAGQAMHQVLVASVEVGRTHCEALYRERMARGLEPVEGMGVEEVMRDVKMLKDAAVCFGAAVDDDTEWAWGHEIKMTMRSIESAIRTLAGQERGE